MYNKEEPTDMCLFPFACEFSLLYSFLLVYKLEYGEVARTSRQTRVQCPQPERRYWLTSTLLTLIVQVLGLVLASCDPVGMSQAELLFLFFLNWLWLCVFRRLEYHYSTTTGITSQSECVSRTRGIVHLFVFLFLYCSASLSE